MKKALVVFGTRPEAIKMAPLVKKLQESTAYSVRVCVTAQHRSMLDQVLEIFDILPDYDLDVMKPNQDLFDITSNILLKLKPVLDDFQPDEIFVHGDTSTTFAASLAGFYRGIDICHIEAGLRTNNIRSPFPEEANRKLTAVITKSHFVPTTSAKENLIKEGYSEQQIVITGNTVIDALNLVENKLNKDEKIRTAAKEKLSQAGFHISPDRKLVLVTGHRRENFGKGVERICDALLKVATTYPDVDIVYPVHLNPNVKDVVTEKLGGVSNIHLISPLDYVTFIYLMINCYLVVTDSGGIQEEAPSLGKPVLVMRDVTERPEAISAGTVKLVGTDVNKIFSGVADLLEDRMLYDQISKAVNPYGDGIACDRIVDSLLGGKLGLAQFVPKSILLS